jgi:hypothetical protein
MATILEAIGDYLEDNGFGTLGTNIWLGIQPQTPDQTVTVYENAGSSPTFTMGPGGIRIDYPMLQIVVRGVERDYPDARDKAENIRQLLAAVLETTISGVHIMRIEPMGSVNMLGVDGKQRPLISVNFRCLVRM